MSRAGDVSFLTARVAVSSVGVLSWECLGLVVEGTALVATFTPGRDACLFLYVVSVLVLPVWGARAVWSG